MTVFLVALPVAVLFSRIPVDIERAMPFPMALNPPAWGVWNVVYVRSRRRLPIGWHGVALAVLLVAAGSCSRACFRVLLFIAPIVWLSGAVMTLRRWDFGYFFASVFYFGMMFGEPTHFIFPFIENAVFTMSRECTRRCCRPSAAGTRSPSSCVRCGE